MLVLRLIDNRVMEERCSTQPNEGLGKDFGSPDPKALGGRAITVTAQSEFVYCNRPLKP
jgi:hypothetical protein